jgi:hypothetical protein
VVEISEQTSDFTQAQLQASVCFQDCVELGIRAFFCSWIAPLV